MSEAEATGNKYWHAADFFVALTYLSLLYMLCFIGSWGLIQNPTHEIRLFPQAFLGYLVARTLPLRWALGVLAAFIALIAGLQFFPNFFCCSLGYFLGLALGVYLLQNKRAWVWALAPLAVHLCGILYLTVFGYFRHDLTGDIVQRIQSLSGWSLLVELISLYPLLWLADRLNELLNWLRWLE